MNVARNNILYYVKATIIIIASLGVWVAICYGIYRLASL